MTIAPASTPSGRRQPARAGGANRPAAAARGRGEAASEGEAGLRFAHVTSSRRDP